LLALFPSPQPSPESGEGVKLLSPAGRGGGEGVFIHPTTDVVQEMGNKGYNVASIETLVAKGHQLLMNYFILLIYAITKK